MYTANLTAHLTLDHAQVDLSSLEDLLTQKEYSWSMIRDRNLETMMLNHDNKDYRRIAEKAEKKTGVEDGIAGLNMGGTVFIDDNSVLEVYLRGDCQAKIIKTGRFTNHWSFGMQINSPYETYINGMLLRYREEGWLTDIHSEWYSGDGKAACSASLGSDSRFSLPILSGLFLILGVGILLSLISLVLELLYVAHEGSVRTGSSFGSCLKTTIGSKCSEVKEDWCGRGTITETKIHDISVQNNGAHNIGHC